MSTLPSSAGLGRAVSSAGVLKVQNGILGPSQIGGGSLAGWWDPSRSSTVYSDGGAHFTAASSQYLSIASNSTLAMGDNVQFTIFGWAKFDAVSVRGFFCKWVSAGSDLEYALLLEGSVLKMYGKNTAGTLTSANHGSTLTTGTWYFLAGGWDGTNLWCSVNGGARVTTALSTGVRSSSDTVRIGTLDGFHNFMDGSFDSMGIAKRSYSDAELASLYNSGSGRVYADLATIGFSTTSLVSWWDLNEECYSDDTEIMTEDGWKYFAELLPTDKVATLSNEGIMTYEIPSKFISFNFKGKMFHQKSKGLDLLVTPQHQMIVRKAKAEETDTVTLNGFERIMAKDLPKQVIYKRNMKWEGEEKETFTIPALTKNYPVTQGMRDARSGNAKLLNEKRWGFNPKESTSKQESDTYATSWDAKEIPMDKWLAFFGIWLAEGNTEPNRDRITVSQSKKANPEKYETIKKWIVDAGFTPYCDAKGFTFNSSQISAYLRQFGKSNDKFIPKELKSLSTRQLKILIDAMLMGDGHKKKGNKNGESWEYATSSKRLADDFQEIVSKYGWVGIISQSDCRDKKYQHPANFISYRINTSSTDLLRKVNSRGRLDFEWVDYDGIVYDLTVPNHTLYVRRNGKPVWSTNSGTRYDAHGTNHLTASSTVLISPSVLNGGFETAGAGQTLGSEILSNTGFETAGGGGADVFGSWTEGITGDGTVTDETTDFHGGAHAAKLNTGATGGAYIFQGFTSTPGTRYKLTYWTRGDGTRDVRHAIYDTTHSAYIISATHSLVTGTSYAQVTLYFTAPAGATSIGVELNSPSTLSGYGIVDDVSLKAVTADDVFANWTDTFSGSSTINDETSSVNAGSHACRFDIDASQSLPRLTQNVARSGDRYSISFAAKGSAGTKMGASFANNSYIATLTTSYVLYSTSLLADSPTLTIFPYPTVASTSVYVDTITVTDLGPVGIAGIAAGLATDGNFCGQFNGTNQYLTVASNSNLNTSGKSYSIAFWVSLDAIAINKPIVQKGFYTGDYEIDVDGAGNFSFYILPSGGSITAASWATAPTVGNWYFIVAYVDLPNLRMGISVNGGTAVTTAISAGSAGSTTALTIGGSSGAMNPARIDAVGYWTKVLSAGEITTLFNVGKGLKYAGLSGSLLTSLISYWNLDKKMGITVDSHGTNTLTNNGSVTYGQGVDYYEGVVSKALSISPIGLNATQTTNSKRPAYVTSFQNGKAMLLFDGVDDYLAFTEINLGTANSAFIVVRPTTVGAVGSVAIGGTSSYLFDLETNLYYGFVGNNVSVTSGLSIDTTYILGVVRNGTSVQFYKNGDTLGAAQTLATNTAMAVSNIGSYNNGSGTFKGYMADPLIYNTALSASQVSSVFRYLNQQYRVY